MIVIENPYIKERKDTSLARKMKSLDLFPHNSHNATDGSLPATENHATSHKESAETKQQELLPQQSLDKSGGDVESKAPEESNSNSNSSSNTTSMFFDIVVSRTLAKPSIPLNYLPNSTQVLPEKHLHTLTF